jgi:hypothetical protein
MTTWNSNPINMISPAPKAAADLSAKQYYYVKKTTATAGNIAGGATGEFGAGVLMNKPQLNDPMEIAGVGNASVPIKLGGTISAIGTEIIANASGLGIAASAAGDIVIGIALNVGVSGDVIDMVPVAYRKHA